MKSVILAGLGIAFPFYVHGAELPLKRVVLSTSGTAQLTHAGSVEPGGAIDLSVRLDQVDDVLKSMTVFGREGAIGAISLPGKMPLEELFRDLPFTREALESPAALLNALVGSQVEITGEVNAKGRIFRVSEEEVQLPNNGGRTTQHRLALMTDQGLVQAVLERLSGLKFTEALTNSQVEAALSGIAQNRAKERRTLSIALSGQSAREVGFSYVVGAPVWKTTYRLVIPKEGGKARLQGWGIVENLMGSDWKDIDLTLMSGNPVALKQQLYSPVFVERPEVPVSTAATTIPGVDDQGPTSGERNLANRYMRAKSAAKPISPAPAMAMGQASADRSYAEVAREEIGVAAGGVEAEEGATQVLYRFPAKVSLAAGSTMMIAFADREIAATKTWLYQPETNARRPLAAIRLKNDTESALPPGIVTVFDAGADGSANFAGDAQLAITPKGATKFVTFALDSKTEIRRLDRGIRRVRLGKAVNGQLTIDTKSTWSIDYEITPPVEEDREVVIEELRTGDWKPVPETKDVEDTASRHRYKVATPKGKTTKTSFTRDLVEQQSITLTSLDPDRLYSTISGLENASAALKDAVVKLGGIVGDISRGNAKKRDFDAERKKISDDQERIRRNLSSVGQGSDLGRRYIENLKAQEDRLTAINNEEKALDGELAAKRKQAEDVARSLTL